MLSRTLTAIAMCLSGCALSCSAFRPSTNISLKAPPTLSTSRFSSDNDQQYMGDGDGGSDETQTDGNSVDDQYQSLTRQDPSIADVPTENRPVLEVPIDGSIVVLAPAVVIGVVGVICSIYLAFNSGDEFVQSVTQIGSDIGVQASIQPDQVYDPNVCRGICTQDQEGLKNFMQSLGK